MIILDNNGSVVENPDYDKGRVEMQQKTVTHTYIIDVEEEGHYEVIAEYPETGGQDVEWKIDVKEEGHWETRDETGEIVEHYDGIIPEDWPKDQVIDDVWQYSVYTPYTAEELEQMKQDELMRQKSVRYSEQMNAATLLFVRSSAKTMNDAQALSVSLLFEEWDAKSHYEKNDIRQYKDNIYRCINDHDSQESWTPDVAHSQWVRIRPEGEILEWEPVQPGVNEPYKEGDKVKHNGKTWVSTINNNTWEPGVYGWNEVV